MSHKATLYIDQGASFETFIQVPDEDFDLTTYDSIVGRMRKHYESANAVTLDCSASNTSTIRIGLTANATAALDSDRYVFTIELVLDTEVERVVSGLALVDMRA